MERGPGCALAPAGGGNSDFPLDRPDYTVIGCWGLSSIGECVMVLGQHGELGDLFEFSCSTLLAAGSSGCMVKQQRTATYRMSQTMTMPFDRFNGLAAHVPLLSQGSSNLSPVTSRANRKSG